MTTSSRLAAHRATVTAAQAQEDEEVPTPAVPGEEEEDCEAEASKKKDNKPMPEANDTEAAIAAARKEATAAANARFSAVLASEHYAGRETLAHNLLAKEALSADDIVSALAEAPAPAAQAPAKDEQDDAAAREEMKAAIEATGNSDLVTGGDKKTDPKAAIDASWDRARANANPHLKIKE